MSWYRCLAAIAGDSVRLFTRNGLDWTEQFGAIVAPLQKLKIGSALIDGEICAFDGRGRTDFSTLKSVLSDGGRLEYFAFDLLEADVVVLQRVCDEEQPVVEAEGAGVGHAFYEEVPGVLERRQLATGIGAWRRGVVLARRRAATLEWALLRIALAALEEQLHALASAEAGNGTTIASHAPPLRRGAAWGRGSRCAGAE